MTEFLELDCGCSKICHEYSTYKSRATEEIEFGKNYSCSPPPCNNKHST